MAASIGFHVDLALSLLNAGMVFNVMFMEGQPVSLETTFDGHAVTLTVPEYVQRHPQAFAEEERAFCAGLENRLTRRQMLDFADMVLEQDWQQRVGAQPLHGTLTIGERNPMRCSFFLFTATAAESVARAVEPSTVFASGFRGHLGCAVRILPTAPLRLSDLRLSQDAVSVADAKGGLLLVVGSTGVGKSTTAAAYIDHVNATRAGTIVTAEDPIEVPIRSRASVVTQREVGQNVASVRMALRDAERNFAHSAFVGEIRTTEEESDTFAAARKGLFVVATSFANHAVEAVKTLVANVDASGSDGADLVASTLLAVIYQVRLPAIEAGQWEFAYESLVVQNDREVRGLVGRRDWPGLFGKVAEHPHASLSGSLAELVRTGRVRRENALMHAYDKERLVQLLEADGAR